MGGVDVLSLVGKAGVFGIAHGMTVRWFFGHSAERQAPGADHQGHSWAAARSGGSGRSRSEPACSRRARAMWHACSCLDTTGRQKPDEAFGGDLIEEDLASEAMGASTGLTSRRGRQRVLEL